MRDFNKEYLLDWLKTSHSKSENNSLVRKFKENEKIYLFLISLVDKVDASQAARVTWVLRNWSAQNNELANNFTTKFMNILERSDNDSVLRNLSGIFIDNGFPTKLEGRLTHYCFRVLLENKRAIAVHANSLALLYQLHKKFPELDQEIKATIFDHPNRNKASFNAGIKRFRFKKPNIN